MIHTPYLGCVRRYFSRHSYQLFVLVTCASVLLGFVFAFNGTMNWDTTARIVNSNAVLRLYGLLQDAPPKPLPLGGYATVSELILGIGTHYVFFFLHDPLWVRYALTFSLFPISLFLLYKLLIRSGADRATSFLCTATMFSIIRLGGHALTNEKDAPTALIYLLATVYLWVLLRERKQSHSYTLLNLLLIGTVSILPFLLRVPLLLHFTFVIVFFGYLLIFDWSTKCFARKAISMLFVLLTGLTVLYLLYPPIWVHIVPGKPAVYLVLATSICAGIYLFSQRHDRYLTRWLALFSPLLIAIVVFLFLSKDDPSGLQHILRSVQASIRTFQAYPHQDGMYLFGKYFPSFNIPIWYVYFWIPLIIHPFGLFLCILGLLALLQSRSISYDFQISFLRRTLNFTLQRWLFLITVAGFGIVLIVQPNLYEDERHLLFLYPPLFLLCILGLNFLPKKAKIALATLLLICSLTTYMQWGRYSYIFSNFIFGVAEKHIKLGDNYHKWNGDMRGLCSANGVNALVGRVPQGSRVVLDVPPHLVDMEVNRLQKEGTIRYSPHFDYTFDDDRWSLEPIYYVLSHDSYRSGYFFGTIQKAISTGQAQLLWKKTLPNGKDICILAHYPNGDFGDYNTLAKRLKRQQESI